MTDSAKLTTLEMIQKGEFPEHSFSKTQLNILHFFQLLLKKRLYPQKNQETVFYDSPARLFCALTGRSLVQAPALLDEILEWIMSSPDWDKEAPELGFLEEQRRLLEALSSNPNSPIFAGFLLVLFSAKMGYHLKLYQFHEGKSLVSCEVGQRNGRVPLKVGVFIFADGFKFSILEKQQDPSEFVEDLFNRITTDDSTFEVKLTASELLSLKILNEHLGFYPQLFVDYSELLTEKEYQARCKAELSDVFHKITRILLRERGEQENGRGKLLSIENLGLEGLNPRLKADVLFGHKISIPQASAVTSEDLSMELTGSSPPGLHSNYALKKTLTEIPQSKTNLNDNNKESQPDVIEGDVPNVKGGGSPVNTKKPVIVNQNKNIRYLGRIKFIDEKNQYGFIIKEADGTDIFFHLSDLELVNLPIKTMQEEKELRYSFAELEYIGKHSLSKKAVDIKLFTE